MPLDPNLGYVVKSRVDAALSIEDDGDLLGIETVYGLTRITTFLSRTPAEIASPTVEDVANTGVFFQNSTTKALYYSNGSGLVAVSSGAGSGASLGAATPLGPAAAGSVGTSLAASHEDHVHPLPGVFNNTRPGLVPQAGAVPSASKYLTETGAFSTLPTFAAGSAGLVPAADLSPDAGKFLTETGTFAAVTKSNVGLSNVDNTSDAVKNAAVATLTNKTLNAPIINSPTGLQKIDVGLGNVDNTSDAVKNAAVATLTNKILVAPVISTISNTGTLTLPTSTDTLVGRATTDTLINKTISGSTNTLTNIPAGNITGIIPIANLATGTPTGNKFLRDDGTLQPIPGGGDAFTTAPLSQFASTTSAQLRSTVTDSIGIGQLVFNTMPTLLSPIVGTQLPNDNSTKAASTAYVAEERNTVATLTNKTLDGNVNTFHNVPASSIIGVIPPANLGTGTPTGAKFLRDDGTFQSLPGGGNALTSSPLSQFVATTSAQLAGVISDETGTGSLVFATSPTLVTPNIGAATGTSLSLSNALPVTSGGTGLNAVAPYAPIFGGTTSNNPFQVGTIGAAGFVLTSNGPGALPTFQAPTGGGGSSGPVSYADITPGSSALFAASILDETGTGSVVFSNSPTLVTPNLGAATAGSINRVSFTQPATGSTLTIADGKVLSATNSLTLAGTDGSTVNFGSGGTVAYTTANLSAFASTTSAQLAGVLSDETGTGSVVFSNSPTLVTPNLGAATATSISLATPLPVSSGGIGATGLTVYAPLFGGTIPGGPIQSGTVGTAGHVLTSNGPGSLPTFQAPTGGGGGGNALTSSPLSQFAATTSAQLASVLTDETGTGVVVYSDSPTLITPNLGAATATSVNRVTFTQPASGATLTIANGKILATNNTVTLSGTDGSSVNYGTGGTIAYTASNLGAFAATSSAQLASVISDETGTGSLVFATSPSLVTPNIGAAAGTSLTLSNPLAVASGGLGTATLTAYAPVFGGTTGTGPVQSGAIGSVGQVLTSNGPGVLPSFQNSVGNALTSNPLSQFASTTSAQLASVLSDETGVGSVVFSTSPALLGTPTAPTAVAGTNTTQIATTAHVFAERSSSATLTNKTLTSPVLNTPVISSPTGLVKADVGLSNVDNTSDITKNSAAGTLTNKNISGATNTLTNIPAANITGVIPIANLATGIPTGTKFIRDDGTLQVVATGNALTSSPLSQFASTTSAQLASVLSDETGTGSVVFANSPVLITPNIGSATGASLSLGSPLGVTSGGLGVATLSPYSPLFAGISSTGSVQTTPLGTIGQVLMSNGTGALPTFQTLPGGGNAMTTNPLSQFSATTSAQLASVMTDETGSGPLVFANSPVLTNPSLGAATATSLSLVSPLAVNSGGIGAASLTAYAPLFGGTTSTGTVQSGTVGTSGQVLMSNGPGALPTFQNFSGGGNAQTANPLSQFAATTSAQLAGVMTDETGTGALVFAGSPALTGVPTAPTAAAGTNTTQLATTAHVFAERINTATITNKTISGANNALSVRIADLIDTSAFMKTFLASANAAAAVSVLGSVASVASGNNITITGTVANPIVNANSGSFILEGGVPNSDYTGSVAIDGGTPSTSYAGSIPIDGGTP